MSLFVEDEPESTIPVEIPVEITHETTPIYKSTEVTCTLPLQFHQEIVSDMLSKDGLLILGRGLGWESITANLLYALASPLVSLVTGPSRTSRKALVFVLNAREEENSILSDELTDLRWINTLDVSDQSPLTIIGSNITTVDKRRKVYDAGGCVSVTSRVLAVDLLSGIIKPSDITGLFVLHAERMRETSNESFIINLYRDGNDWGFVKAVSDEPELFTGFTPLASRLKVLRLTNVFLWPRFHVEVSSSLISKKKNDDLSRFVTEVNVHLSYKMSKIQSAILSCLGSCLQELKRHNPLLVTDYWDMENLHHANFVQRIRLSLEPQWHRISWTSKQLVHDLSTLQEMLSSLLTLDSLAFYQIVQGIIDLNVKTSTTGTMFTSSMSPWLNLDEANTIISYAKERALGTMKIQDLEESEYVLEELPKWDQLGILIDDIMFEKSTSPRADGPVLIMCSSRKVVRQLHGVLQNMRKIENPMTGKKKFSSRNYMVNKLQDYLLWKEVSRVTKQISLDLDKPEESEETAEDLQTSKSFTRGKGFSNSKRRRTRGASAVANVNKLYSGSVNEKNTEAVELDPLIMEKIKEEEEVEEEDDDDDSVIELKEEEPLEGGFIPEEPRVQPSLRFHHIEKSNQIIIEKYNERTNDNLLQEICPSHIIMYEPSLSFIRRVEVYQAVNKESPARTFFMYYGTSVEEQTHLTRIKTEKEAFTKLIREKASLSKSFQTDEDNWKFKVQKLQVVNTRIAGGANFRTETDEMAVIVDVREFNSSLPNLLYRVGLKVIPCMITVGDYIVSPKICVERKAIPDLISSFKSGRLYTQCEQMFRHYETPALLIEFDENQSFSFEPFSELRKSTISNPLATKWMQQEIQSKIIMLLVSFPKLKIIWSSSPYETAQIFLELKANQEEPDISEAIAKGVNPQIQSNNSEPPMYNDDAIDLIQNIPGINNVNYYTVIQKIRSIEELVQLNKQEFIDMLGEENGNRAYNFINHSVA